MLVQIKANPHPGHDAVWAIDRRFPASFIPIEVVQCEKGQSVPKLETQWEGKTLFMSDPGRISFTELDALKADGRFSILADGESSEGLAQDAIDAAKAEAARHAARAASAEAENASLRAQLAALQKPKDGKGKAAKDQDPAPGAGEQTSITNP